MKETKKEKYKREAYMLCWANESHQARRLLFMSLELSRDFLFGLDEHLLEYAAKCIKFYNALKRNGHNFTLAEIQVQEVQYFYTSPFDYE